jgi:hypothetical protein
VSFRDLEVERQPETVSRFDADIASAARYERGLAVKILIPLLIVAVLVLIRVFAT